MFLFKYLFRNLNIVMLFDSLLAKYPCTRNNDTKNYELSFHGKNIKTNIKSSHFMRKVFYLSLKFLLIDNFVSIRMHIRAGKSCKTSKKSRANVLYFEITEQIIFYIFYLITIISTNHFVMHLCCYYMFIICCILFKFNFSSL